MNIQAIVKLMKDAFHEWSEDKVPRLGAALAYYSVFSLGPLLMIAIAVAGLIFGAQAAQAEVVGEIKETVGEPVAKALSEMLANSNEQGFDTAAAVVGFVILLFGAAGVFGQLQDALNTIWKVAPKPGRGIWGIIQDRFLSLTMVLGTGFLLLVSLVVTSALSAFGAALSSSLPGGAGLWQPVNLVVSFAIITLLFAMIYRFLPDARIAWRDVWVGAAITALLFSVGKFLLGWYLGRGSVGAAYGAAGSLVVVLLWVYYSSLVLLYGAELTRVYAERYGSGVKPKADAVALPTAERERQGMPRSEALAKATAQKH